MMVDVTKEAMEELEKLAASRDEMKPLRIHVAGYGWGGPTFGLALDELKDGDVESKVEDFTFIIEDKIVETYGDFVVDFGSNFLRKGFSVMPKGHTAGSC